MDQWPKGEEGWQDNKHREGPEETNFEKLVKKELEGSPKEEVGEKLEDAKLFDYLLKGQKSGILELKDNPNNMSDVKFTLNDVIDGVRALQERVRSGTNKSEDLKFTLAALDKFVNGNSTQEENDVLFGMARFAKESKS